jgi:hypothetical protein
MINIFISSLIGSMVIIANGYIFNYLIFKKKINEFNVYKDTIFGFVLIGFISLLINFFLPINKNISSIFLIFSIFVFIYFYFKSEKKKNILWILIYLTITTFLIITFANINRPDAGLYHLPFVKILNENKLILGLTNLHYRFGHTSIFQYISALHVNFFFKEEFLNIPLALLPGLYFLYLFENFSNSIKRKNEKNIIILFLITAFSLYSFNRFSGLGNDGPASIFFFILVIQFLIIQNIKNIKPDEFYKILIFSLFLLMLKPFMIFGLIIPMILLLINENKLKLIKDKKNIFCLILIFLWFLKNIFMTSCIIFPLKQTCFEKLTYSNTKVVNIASKEAEAWAKGYPDSKIKKGFDQYNSNFNWIETWSENHFKKRIVKKILPLLILILLLISFSFIGKNYYKNLSIKKIFSDKKLLYLIYFLTFCLLLWFLKFPVYRFGLGFLSSFIIIVYVFIFISNEKKFYNKKALIIILVSGFFIVYTKNISRIINKLDQNYYNAPWPAMYSMNENENKIKNFKKIYDKKNNFLYYYSNGVECMYTNSPCSNYLNKSIKKTTKYGYQVFFYEKD